MLMIIKEKPNVTPKQPMANILVIWLMEYLMNSSKMGSHLDIGRLVISFGLSNVHLAFEYQASLLSYFQGTLAE